MIDFDAFDGPLVRLEPETAYDSCIIGVDPYNNRIVYDEHRVLLATMQHNEWDAHDATEWFTYNILPLTEMEGGPIFVTRSDKL